MHALYAFFRISDDISDNPQTTITLSSWRDQLKLALRNPDGNRSTHPILPALCHTITTYAIPERYLFELLDGVESDLATVSFEDSANLNQYLYRVASTVGLCCIRVWGLMTGVSSEDVEPLAIQSGYAFQWTNILRDLSEDARNHRCYIPSDILARFQISPQDFLNPEFAKTQQFEAFLRERYLHVKSLYQDSQRLQFALKPTGRSMFRLMHRTYEALLDQLWLSRHHILNRRIRLSRWSKARWFLAEWYNARILKT